MSYSNALLKTIYKNGVSICTEATWSIIDGEAILKYTHSIMIIQRCLRVRIKGPLTAQATPAKPKNGA